MHRKLQGANSAPGRKVRVQSKMSTMGFIYKQHCACFVADAGKLCTA